MCMNATCIKFFANFSKKRNTPCFIQQRESRLRKRLYVYMIDVQSSRPLPLNSCLNLRSIPFVNTGNSEQQVRYSLSLQGFRYRKSQIT